MGFYTILKNSSIEVQLESDYQDNGWSFQDGLAIHSPYNEGSIRNTVFRPQAEKEYNIKIQVSGITTGYLDVYLGGKLFGRITQTGFYELIDTTEDTTGFVLSAGLNSVQVLSLSITEGITEGQTIVYDSESKQYNGNISLFGDRMERFLDDLIVFKAGVPWVQDRNDTRNSFFGQTYPSIITFFCNVEYDKDKDFYSISLNGNSPWRVDLILPPREGKSRGQRSRIKTGRFRLEKGNYVADILRDMNDPRFSDEFQALMKGAYLQGQLMQVTLTNESTEEVQLVSVDIDVSIK